MILSVRTRRMLRVMLVTAAVLLAAWGPRAAVAETSEELQARLELAKSMLSQLETQKVEAGEALYETQYALDQTRAQIESTRIEVGNRETQLEQTREMLAKRVKASYKAGHGSPLASLLDEDCLDKITSLPYYANKMAEQDAKTIQEVKDAKSALEEQTVQLESLQVEQEALLEKQRSQLEVLQTAEASQADYVNSLDQALRDQLEQETQRELLEQRAAAGDAQAQLELELARKAEQDAAASAPEAPNQDLGQSAQNGGASYEAGNAISTMSNETRLTILRAAFSQIGVPYLWGGEQPGVGLDCSGFTQYCYRQAGIELPHSARAQSVMARATSMENMQPGDLVFWIDESTGRDHVAMYIGGGNIIHESAGGCRIIALYGGYTKLGIIV